MYCFIFTCHQIPGGTSEDIAKEGAVIPTCDGDAANVDFCNAINYFLYLNTLYF